jgi:tetratricopeptide (TPR) repeat protein
MGVGMVATGRVRSAGEGLDIKVELVDVASNAQTWGASYSSREPDLAATQETIALAVREQLLRHAFGPGFRPAPYQVSNPLSRNPLAVRAYLKANEFRRNPGRTQIRTGIERFKDAVALDPGFVRAYAGLGVSYVVITYFDELPATETIGQAKEYARKAVQLDPGQALGHQALAFVSHSFDYDQKEAEDHFHHAIATVQPAPGPLNWYADFLIEMDRFDEAEAMLRRAVEADPTWLQNDIVHANGLLFAGRTAEAIATYQSVLRADPNHGLARYFLGRAYLDAGRPAEAIAELRQAGAAMGDPPFARAGLANALAQSGSRGEATQMLADFMQRRHDAYYPAFAIAAVHAGLGDTAAALDWLERAANERLVGYYMPNVDKMWKPLRSQARFRALLDRLGVPLFPES